MADGVIERPTDEECYLYAIMTDPSGLDLAEFSWYDPSPTSKDGCFRAFDYQWPWWRCSDTHQIEMSARAIGKTFGIMVRMFAFPFGHAGEEALVTAPQLVHLEPIIKLIERRFQTQRLGREVVLKDPTHRPFTLEFKNNSRILGRIPQRDGVGVKGTHPAVLEQEEACFAAGTSILTHRGLVSIENVDIGDEVFTHENRWKKVTNTFQYERETIEVGGQGCPRLEVTPNHRFWVSDVAERDWRKRGYRRVFSSPIWMPISEAQGAYWCSPVQFPASPIPTCEPHSVRELTHDVSSEQFAWILGLYLAEGSLASQYGVGGIVDRVYLSVHQKEVPHVVLRLEQAGLASWVRNSSQDKSANIVIGSKSLARWLETHVPRGAHNKQVPVWVLGTSSGYRNAVLDGLLYGDGADTIDPRYTKGRRRLSTTSHNLAISARLLGASLGYHTSIYWNPAPKKPMVVRGQEFHSGPSWEVIFALAGQGVFDGNKVFNKIKRVSGINTVTTVYDLEVEDDHSFTANGIVVHNSDYPKEGWSELVETLNRSALNATWHAHGVTIGVGNEFHRNSEHAIGEDPLRPVSHADEALFTVHRIPAMFHPDWSDLERRRKHNQYPDESEYRRNVLGLPGDAMSPIFPANALWRCVEDDQSAEFNQEEYWHVTIKDIDIDTQQRGILNLLQKPPTHVDQWPIWVGLDYGLLGDPTEILIFAEVQLDPSERKIATKRGKACPDEGFSRLKMIGRITLIKILEPAQAEVIMWICENYQVKRFTFDATGIGLPLFQYIKYQESDPNQAKVRRAKKALEAIWGYNFSSNILVDFDERLETDNQRIDEKIKKQGIERNVKEYSTDVARVYVADQRMWFPWDVDFMKELQMSKYRYERDEIDRYGRRKRAFSGGQDHCLDALRMAVLGHRQFSLDTFIANQESDPILEAFIDQSEFMMFGGTNSLSQMDNPDDYAGGYDIEFGGYAGDYGGVPSDWQDSW